MEGDNDEFILKLLDESLRSGEGEGLGYDSDNLVEIFDDDSDADPNFVLSEQDSVSDIEINEPGPSTSSKRKFISSTPKKGLFHKKHKLFDDKDQQEKTCSLDFQQTTDIQQWRPVDLTFSEYPFNPENESVGINPDIIDSMSDCLPIDFFQLFLDEEVLSLLVTETNRYAQQCLKIAFSPHSRLAKWTDCTQEEIKIFIGILVMMGLQPLPSLAHYWRQDDMYISRIPEIMSRNRFELLLRMFHFSDNETVEQGDRLSKISNLVTILNEKF